MSRPLARWLVLVSALSAGGCVPAEPPATRAAECTLTVGYRPGFALGVAKRAVGELAEPTVIGNWDGWRAPADVAWSDATGPDGTAWRVAKVPLPPGRWQYAIARGEQLVLDEVNPHTGFTRDPFGHGTDPLGTEVSEIEVPDCSRPKIDVTSARAGFEAETIVVDARFVRGVGGAAMAAGSVTATIAWAGVSMPAPAVEIDGERIVVRAGGLAAGKYSVRISARDESGVESESAEASAFVEKEPGRAREDGVVYHVFIDRFRGNGPLTAPARLGDRAGGTLDGVTAAIVEGWFEKLGVTTLWLSPVYRNPSGHFTGRDGHQYEAYHGYWPSEPRAVEPAIGGERALEALVAAAHARGLRVILDAVPNHVYETHPYYLAHSRQVPEIAHAAEPRLASWFNDGPEQCVCGRAGCPWSESCWFDRYLPDVEWRHPDVMRAGTDDLRWWMSRFDVDGIRIDAVPMMPRAATRRMAHALRTQSHREGLDLLVLGENYTGPGGGGRALLRTYLGRDLDGLDSEFDFPLLWATRAALAGGTVSMRDLEAEIAAAEQAYAGSGAVMGHMIDNHDMSRFITEATGGSALDPWTEAPPQPTSDEPYRKQLLAMTLVMTLPGLPVIYYGDELALAGANDPDSRRVMPEEQSLLPGQRDVLTAVRTLGRLRRCAPELRRGARRVLFTDAERSIALRAGEHPILVVLSRGGGAPVALEGLTDGHYVDVLGGGALDVASGRAELPTAALTAAVYVREDSPCID